MKGVGGLKGLRGLMGLRGLGKRGKGGVENIGEIIIGLMVFFFRLNAFF